MDWHPIKIRNECRDYLTGGSAGDGNTRNNAAEDFFEGADCRRTTEIPIIKEDSGSHCGVAVVFLVLKAFNNENTRCN